MEKTTEEEIPKAIGPYQIEKRIGRGGMGEVFTAKDPMCGRTIVIKRVRPDLIHHEVIRKRFMKEAYIASNLNHPSIIPVFSVEISKDELYYVMPYVEGKSLKQILREAAEHDKENRPHPLLASTSSALRIFLNICSALSYCHEKKILHRDVKPENILIGKHSEVYLIDWGLASQMQEKIDLSSVPAHKLAPQNANITRVGKIFGTLAYLPPERISGKAATPLTEIYSLGVILYQLLTLRMPFHRRTMEEYKRSRKYGKPINLEEAAPLRDIPHRLAEITKKCLEEHPDNRYQSVETLQQEIERFQEGTPAWIHKSDLNIANSDHWEIQENVLFSKLISITHSSEIMEWVYLMISKEGFSGNKKITLQVRLNPSSSGIGFILNSPEPKERKSLDDGYLVWLGSSHHKGISLARSNVTIYDLPEKELSFDKTHTITIEKIDHSIKVYLGSELLIDYYDHLPIVGTHVGILCRDMDFTIENLSVYVGSQSVMVNCLSVPDAFLASKNFDQAFKEYERISHSFSNRKEGRDALFRLGITLIEKAKHSKSDSEKRTLLEQAEDKFSQIPSPMAAPLISLGQSLVYRELKNLIEEVKCLELAIRRYEKHPMIHLIEEHINFRLHECAKNDREGVYHFSLLTLRHLPHLMVHRDTHSLIHNLMNHTEPLYFFHRPSSIADLEELHFLMTIQLAFWLNRALILHELLEDLPYPKFKDLIRFSLMQLNQTKPTFPKLPTLLHKLPESPHEKHYWPIFFRISQNLTRTEAAKIYPLLRTLKKESMPHYIKKELNDKLVWANLLLKDYASAKSLVTDSTAPFLKGCLIVATEGKEAAMKFFGSQPEFVFPPISHLLGHYLLGFIDLKKGWNKKAFFKEKLELYRQLALYYHICNKRAKALYYERKLKKTAPMR